MTPYADRIMLAVTAARDAAGLLPGRKLGMEETKAVMEGVLLAILAEQKARWDAAGVRTPPVKKAPVARKRNELLDELVRLCGGDPDSTTKSEFRAAAVALAEIRDVCPALTVEELRSRVDCYTRKNRDWALTPPALAKWWSHLGGGERTASAKRDIYIEPIGWRPVLKAMYDLSDAGIRDKQWLDLDPVTRSAILQRMKSA